MFDPTAFENMKVVIEGALYDLDLDDDIQVLDRNDIVNMAKLSRTYDVTFSMKNKESVQCTFSLEAKLENLAAELLPLLQSKKLAGSYLSIKFGVTHQSQDEIHEMLEKELADIWGNDRSYKQMISFEPLHRSKRLRTEIFIDFNRLVLEDQIDDILHMIDYMILSLERINNFLN